jgi:hypothetical protein
LNAEVFSGTTPLSLISATTNGCSHFGHFTFFPITADFTRRVESQFKHCVLIVSAAGEFISVFPMEYVSYRADKEVPREAKRCALSLTAQSLRRVPKIQLDNNALPSIWSLQNLTFPKSSQCMQTLASNA